MTSPLAGKTQTSAMILRAAVFATLVASASAQGPPPPATGYCPDPKADNYDATGGVESAPALLPLLRLLPHHNEGTHCVGGCTEGDVCAAVAWASAVGWSDLSLRNACRSIGHAPFARPHAYPLCACMWI